MSDNSAKQGLSLDLSGAVVVIAPGAGERERLAARVLVEEVQKRSQLSWAIRTQLPAPGVPAILVGLAESLRVLLPGKDIPDGGPADGYRLSTAVQAGIPRLVIQGNDLRGVLFGAGYLLRQLEIAKRQVLLREELNLSSAPHYSLRGHQLGYRDKTNSYDGWDLAQWDQYMRELAIFGTNAIELIPPRSDDLPDSVHFPLPPLEMMAGMSATAERYGLDVWIWYPAMDDDYSRPEMVEFALREWEVVYRALPRIDAILVPGGDPGNTPPRYLLPMLARQTALLKQFHPDAQMWVSAQGFHRDELDDFLRILRDESPDWLSGVVYGPWVHMTPAEFRRLVPVRYPIRSYPDITHSLDCQYPVPEWDLAYALTEGRETINPRPHDEEAIFRQMGEAAIGFLTYSEGCNDDVNKFVWSGLGWNPQEEVREILRQYSRFFIGEAYAADFAAGILALERNWVGPLALNTGVYTTLQQFQAMERTASPALRQNWRFQQALYRAYYDAYTRSRLLYESGLEEEAMDRLRQAGQMGSLLALEQASAILDRAVLFPVASAWRTRIFQLAEALFQSIHMQLSVPLYAAQSETRGANLDDLDYPLNDRPWLLAQFACVRALPDEAARLAHIRDLLGWTDPGPGGYYLDLSNAYDCPFIVKGQPYEEDPAFYRTPHRRFPYWKNPDPIRRAWRAYTGGLNDFPFQLHFDGLDREAQYRLRVVYSDTEPEIQVRMEAGEGIEIHPYLLKPFPPAPLEFDIPREATRSGELTLALAREPGMGGLGAGHEICELWIRKMDKTYPSD